MPCEATIIFSTCNRKDTMRVALQAARRQTVATRIIVMDDASEDGTGDMMRSEFADVVYCRSADRRGPCFQRNRGIEMAQTEIVFPLDDDSILHSPRTLEQTLQDFTDERIGAVAIPFVNILQSPAVLCSPPERDRTYIVHAFVAAAHALRKSVLSTVGGYRESLFYMGEEGDLCLRMLEKGYVVRLGRADPIHHLQPPGRVSFAADFYGRRNDILFAYTYAPSPLLPLYLLGTTARGITFALRLRRAKTMIGGLMHGYRHAARRAVRRSPVDRACFRTYRRLKKVGHIELESLQAYLSSRPVPTQPGCFPCFQWQP
jgi:glycosyltransferase involved in cell wall biosynthesis